MGFLKEFIFSQSRLPKSKTFEIAEGSCGSDVGTLEFSTVYLVKNILLGNVGKFPELGDYIYTDLYQSIPFNGNGLIYRMGVIKNGSILIFNSYYEINSSGQITSAVDCNSGGSSTTILGQSDTNCFSCMSIEVTVPPGESRHVSVAKTGISPYGFGISNCIEGVEVNFDLEEDITENKIYDIALDSSKGNELANSSITFQVDAETPIVLTRTHNSPLVQC